MGATAIIAAFNEEQTLAEVLTALQRNPLIDEIIVVSDGSTDRTVEIARGFEVRTIALRENQGKGCAMRIGVEHATNDILFFVDGDMLGITDQHIEALVLPVTGGDCDMNVGIRHRGPFLDFFHLKAHCGPVLSGIRVMHREVFESVPVMYMERFKIETALNYFCARAGFRQRNTVIRDLGHVIKEHKLGWTEGVSRRMAMSREVFIVIIDLNLFQTWRWFDSSDLPSAEYDLFEAELAE